ncbi:MAG: ferritin-like domain-containing protein [Phototrophicaceae bacterium]
MALENLRDVFNEQMKDIYSAEKQLSEAMPDLIKAVSSPKLKKALESHLDETNRHMETVRQMLDEMDVNPGNTKCDAMAGLVKEARSMANEDGDSVARDAGIICAAQKAEHYEIATYGSLRAWARVLGEDDYASTLNSLLDEEYEADDKLSKIAEEWLNEKASS